LDNNSGSLTRALQAWEHSSSHRQINANASSFVRAFVNNSENNLPPSNLKAKSRTASDRASNDRNKLKAEALSRSLSNKDTALSPSASGGGATANMTAAMAAPSSLQIVSASDDAAMDAGPKVLGLKAMPNATPNAGGLRPSVGAFASQNDRQS
tara:strand:- start:141 stop:602 length:462 start_codon:yes stop_codon:yes gene_type:complete